MSVPTKYATIMMHVIVDSANSLYIIRRRKEKERKREEGEVVYKADRFLEKLLVTLRDLKKYK